jgi:hypothetical protein
VYLILIAAIIFNYAILATYHHVFMSANDSFTRLFNEKTLLTNRIVEGQYELMGYPHETSYNSTSIGFIDVLYSTYFIKGVSDAYRKQVYQFVSGRPCSFLPSSITSG